MKVIAFVEGRCKPQPRVTQNVRFLFGNTVEYWMKVDAENTKKAEMGLINKKGNPYKATRYAYRLRRLLEINKYRDNVLETVSQNTGGKIPYEYLFFFYLFNCPKSWSKKKCKAMEWQLHRLKPDASNLWKGTEDALYENDSQCNAIGNYKMYVPKSIKEGLLIMQDEEVHKFVIDSAIEALQGMSFV